MYAIKIAVSGKKKFIDVPRKIGPSWSNEMLTNLHLQLNCKPATDKNLL